MSMSSKAPNPKELAKKFGVDEGEVKAYVLEFQSMDTNKDGKISCEELKAGMEKFGCAVTLDQAKAMVKFVDANHDNNVDLMEFLTMITRAIKSKAPNSEQEAMQAFKVFDINKDGFISMAELRTTMAKLGQPLSDKEAAQMMKQFDKNKDGRIDYKEFMAAWKQMTGQK